MELFCTLLLLRRDDLTQTQPMKLGPRTDYGCLQELVEGRQWQPAQMLGMALHQTWVRLHYGTWLPKTEPTLRHSLHQEADFPAATMQQHPGYGCAAQVLFP